MQNIKSITLPNKINVIYEHVDHIRSVLLGCWVKFGSREETEKLFGITHFLEHMLFKGSSKRSALEIAESLELVGGELNGFTSRENCCYYGKVTDDNLPLVCDVIADLVFRPQLDPVEMQREVNVVCQEIDMIEDSLEELVHEKLVETMFNKSLGHSILGTKKHIESFTTDQLRNFHSKLYHPSNVFLTVVGNLQKYNFEEVIHKEFGRIESTQKPLLPLDISSKKVSQHHLIQKDSEQMHLVMGWHSFSVQHDSRYVLHLISAHLGNGMSSVLFQKIREELGLTYNIYSFIRAYRDAGIFGVYAAHSPDNLTILNQTILKIIKNFTIEGIDNVRLEQLKAQLKGNLLLGLEKTAFRMNRMGVGYLYFDHIMSPDDLIELIQKITQEDVMNVAEQIFSNEATIVGAGKMSDTDFEKSIKTRS